MRNTHVPADIALYYVLYVLNGSQITTSDPEDLSTQGIVAKTRISTYVGNRHNVYAVLQYLEKRGYVTHIAPRADVWSITDDGIVFLRSMVV
jgi:hypothetical protein